MVHAVKSQQSGAFYYDFYYGELLTRTSVSTLATLSTRFVNGGQPRADYRWDYRCLAPRPATW